jgi:hypothetical protein
VATRSKKDGSQKRLKKSRCVEFVPSLLNGPGISANGAIQEIWRILQTYGIGIYALGMRSSMDTWTVVKKWQEVFIIYSSLEGFLLP